MPVFVPSCFFSDGFQSPCRQKGHTKTSIQKNWLVRTRDDQHGAQGLPDSPQELRDQMSRQEMCPLENK